MENSLQRPIMNSQEFWRFIKFSLVGLTGTILDFTILIGLKEIFLLTTLLANSLAFSAGVINNFSLNRKWTYADARQKNLWLQMSQFFAVSTVGVALNNTIVLLLEHPLGEWLHSPHSGYLPAKVLATGVVVFWNFLANRYWTFNDAA